MNNYVSSESDEHNGELEDRMSAHSGLASSGIHSQCFRGVFTKAP